MTATNIVIVTSSLSSPGSIELSRAARQLGYDSDVCLVDDAATPAKIDVASSVIYRLGPKSFGRYEKLISNIKNTHHKATLERSLIAFDKCESYKLLAGTTVAMPLTHIINKVEVPPFLPGVLKIARGNQGSGVALITMQEQYDEVASQYIKQGQFLYQEYIAESKGADKRIIVCGSAAVAAMQRIAPAGEFRANIHLGASAVSYRPTDAEKTMAIEAARALGLSYAGVDIIDAQRGPLVLEVNPSPGFGISKIAKIDVSSAVIQCVVKDE